MRTMSLCERRKRRFCRWIAVAVTRKRIGEGCDVALNLAEKGVNRMENSVKNHE
jgi:hypothetical protein